MSVWPCICVRVWVRVIEIVRDKDKERVYTFPLIPMWPCICAYVCVCVREREKDKDKEGVFISTHAQVPLHTCVCACVR